MCGAKLRVIFDEISYIILLIGLFLSSDIFIILIG